MPKKTDMKIDMMYVFKDEDGEDYEVTNEFGIENAEMCAIKAGAVGELTLIEMKGANIKEAIVEDLKLFELWKRAYKRGER